jgi:hypothetical protein
MKIVYSIILATVFASSAMAQDAKPSEKTENRGEMRTVCTDVRGKDGKPVMDTKTNKPKQNCKQVKVRQKYEATKVPGQK